MGQTVTYGLLDGIVFTIFNIGESIFGPQFSGILFLSVGIAIFAAIASTFWSRISKEVLYELDIDEHVNNLDGIIKDAVIFVKFLFHYTIIFPIISFLWFALIAALIYLLSRSISLEEVFPMALAMIIAIRITAYLDETTAGEVAKALPIGLLGAIILEPGTFKETEVIIRVNNMSQRLLEFAPFFLYSVYLEWTMRLLLGVKHFVQGHGIFGPKKEVKNEELEYGTHKKR